jgi:MYXO-CTERM domain-containing protein
MKIKHIAAAALALVAGSSFAAIATNNSGAVGNTGTGLVFIVTDTLNNKSFDFDTGVNYTGFAPTSFSANIAADANWSSFYSATRTADFVWTLVGGKNDGGATVANSGKLLTTVTNGFATSTITTSNAANLAAIVGNLNNVIIDVNTKLATSASTKSVVASQLNSDIAYVGATGLKLDYTLNNQVAPGFTTGNAIGASSQLLALTNAGGRGAVNVYNTIPALSGYTASFDGATLSVTAVPEPETYGLALVGLVLAGLVARRRA